MTTYAMALPIKPGKLADWKRFGADITGPHRAEWQEQLRGAGISAEQVFHQASPTGDFAVIVWDCYDPATVVERMGKPHNDFAAAWLPTLFADVHGLDLAAPPPSPALVSSLRA